MAELPLDKVISFDKGFTISSTTTMISGTPYYLTIDSSVVNRIYIPTKSGTVISDSWASVGYIPLDGSVCFTLLDTTGGACIQPTCSITMI